MNPQLSIFTQLSMAHQQSPHQQRSLGIKSHCTGVLPRDLHAVAHSTNRYGKHMQKMSVGNTDNAAGRGIHKS